MKVRIYIYIYVYTLYSLWPLLLKHSLAQILTSLKKTHVYIYILYKPNKLKPKSTSPQKNQPWGNSPWLIFFRQGAVDIWSFGKLPSHLPWWPCKNLHWKDDIPRKPWTQGTPESEFAWSSLFFWGGWMNMYGYGGPNAVDIRNPAPS